MLHFADDISLLANTERELKEALNVTEKVFNNYKMGINIKKSNVIACRADSGKKRLNVQVGNENIGEISKFCYLGSKIKKDGRCSVNVRSRIGQAKIAFAKIPQ